jgi:hypothetical protein
MTAKSDYFQRVRPLLGDGLANSVVAFANLSLTGRVLDLLAACMLKTVVVRDASEPASWPLTADCGVAEGANAREGLRGYFAWKNEHEPLEWRTEGAADLELRAEWSFNAAKVVVDARARTVTLFVPPGDRFAHLDLCNHAAREARDVLLGRRKLTDSVTHLGNAQWPFAQSAVACPSPRRAAASSGRHVMVVGCGSVGSEVARTLRESVARWTLVDAGKVSAFNPSRQWFGLGEMGQRKVDALARRLAPAPVRAVAQQLGEAKAELLARLIDDDRPDLVILATGTASDAGIAPVLWKAGVAHLVAYAYPQARFFEVTTVLPAEGTPCAHCFRGNLYRGAESQTPVSDEVANFLYSRPQTAERDRAYVDLVAEPATKIETSRLADVVARCAVEALASKAQRAPWLARMLEEGTTCLLGANAVERRDDGRLAYGLATAGQVIRLGLADVAGAEAQLECQVCGRKMDVVHRADFPECSGADVDLWLLG